MTHLAEICISFLFCCEIIGDSNLRYSSIGVQTIIFEFKIMIYEQISAKQTCRKGVSTSWNEMRN